MLESKSRLFRNPSGHGGTLTALAASGFLARCRAEGVEHLFYWQVDNPLVRIGEPLFLGFHDLHGASGMSSKVVAKRGPEEKVGILAACDGRNICVEYSDLPGELRDARDERGDLLYRAGNIAIHALRVGFVESLTKGGLRLPWHRAEKKIRCVDESGAPIEVPGIKFETFIFDALPMSEDTVTLEVLRDDEFAPVKNASGEDSPRSRAMRSAATTPAGSPRPGSRFPTIAAAGPRRRGEPIVCFRLRGVRREARLDSQGSGEPSLPAPGEAMTRVAVAVLMGALGRARCLDPIG